MTADRFGNSGVHVLATPMLVSYLELTARATLTERDGRRLVFRVEADERERVGEGTHERFIVDMGRFMQRISAEGN